MFPMIGDIMHMVFSQNCSESFVLFQLFKIHTNQEAVYDVSNDTEESLSKAVEEGFYRRIAKLML